MDGMNDVVRNTIAHLEKTYFKMEKVDGAWTISQYAGPTRTPASMRMDGWIQHAYLKKYINDDYPIFDISDFKTSDGLTIEKKTNEDLLKEELSGFIEILSLNSGLSAAVKALKDFSLEMLPDLMKYKEYEKASAAIANAIQQLAYPDFERAKLLLKFIDLKSKVAVELDKTRRRGSSSTVR